MSFIKKALKWKEAWLAMALGSLFIVSAMIQINTNYDLGYPESAIVYQIYNLSYGRQIYTDWNKYPYSITPYTPVYYLLTGLVAEIGRFNLMDIYKIARAVTLSFTVGCAFMIYLIGRKAGGRRKGSLICAGIFLANPLLIPWGFTSRPDIPGLFFCLLGLYFLIKDKIKKPILIAGWCSLAIFTKQTYLALPLAILIFGIVQKRYRFAVNFLCWMLLISVAIFLPVNMATGGDFYRNIVLANQTPLKFDIPYKMFLFILMENIFILTGVALALKGKGAVSEDYSILKWYFLISLMWSVGISFKPGSDINYFLEPMALGVIMMGPFVSKFIRLGNSLDIRITAEVFFVLLTLMWMNMRFGRVRQSESIVLKLKQYEEPVLTEDLSLTLRSGHNLVISDPYNFSFLEDGHAWNSSKLVQMVESRKFKAIVSLTLIDQPRMMGGVLSWPLSLLIPVIDNYHLSVIDNGYYLYQPNEK